MSALDLETLDPVARKLVDKIEQKRESDPEEGIVVSDQLIDYAQKQGLADVQGYALFFKGFCQYNLNNTSQAFYTFEQAYKLLVETDQWNLVARSLCCMGIISSSQGNIPVAMDYYLRGISVCEQHDLLSVYVMINGNIGILYQGFHDLPNAKRYFDKCIESVEAVKEQQGDYEPTFSYTTVATLYFNLANSHLCIGEVDKAEKSLRKSSELEQKAPDPSLRLAIKMLYTQILYAQGKEEETLQNIREIAESKQSLGTIIDAFDDVVTYAEFLQSIDRDQEFFDIISRMEESIRETNSTYLSRKLVQLKVSYYKKHQDNKEYLLESGLYFELSMKMEDEMEKSYRESLSTRMNLEHEKRNREKLKTEAANLKIRSEYDALTGLRNRYKITEISENSFAGCLKNQQTLAVEILDVDYFKQYNDNYGHQQGDEVLVKVSSAIRSLERHRGVYTGRYGGDEFIILYVDRTYDEVTGFAQELKDAVERLNMRHEYSLICDRITLSQGVYHGIPNEKTRFWDFLHAADQALYDVKKAGRNDFRISTDLTSAK